MYAGTVCVRGLASTTRQAVTALAHCMFSVTVSSIRLFFLPLCRPPVARIQQVVLHTLTHVDLHVTHILHRTQQLHNTHSGTIAGHITVRALLRSLCVAVCPVSLIGYQVDVAAFHCESGCEEQPECADGC